MDMQPPLGPERLGRPVTSSSLVISERRISWAAVFAGAVVASVLTLALQLIGVGIAAAMMDPIAALDPDAGVGVGAAIWTIGVALAALFVGGWASAKLGGAHRRSDGVLHGLVTWGIVTLLLLYFVGNTVGQVVGGAASLAQPPLGGELMAPDEMAPPDMEGELRRHEESSQAAIAGGAIVGGVAILLGGVCAALGGAWAVHRSERRRDLGTRLPAS